MSGVCCLWASLVDARLTTCRLSSNDTSSVCTVRLCCVACPCRSDRSRADEALLCCLLQGYGEGECSRVSMLSVMVNALCDRASVPKVCCLLRWPVRGVGPRACLAVCETDCTSAECVKDTRERSETSGEVYDPVGCVLVENDCV